MYRRDEGGLWTALAEVEVDGNGQVVYDDATVTPGNEYDYMMVVGSQRGEAFGGTATVEVSSTVGVDDAAVSFALRNVAPNPVVSRMMVSFALESSAPASASGAAGTARRTRRRAPSRRGRS